MERYDLLSEYLGSVTDQIRCKKARGYISEELACHIEDQKEAFIEDGLTEEEALKESLRQMGDPVSVGVEMDRIHRPRPDWKLLAFISIFSIVGLILQYHICLTAGTVLAADPSSSPLPLPGFSQFANQCCYTLVGLLCMAVIYYADYTLIGRFSLLLWWLFFFSILFVVCTGPVLMGSFPYLRIYLYLFAPLFAGILYRARGGGFGRIFLCILHGLCALLLAGRGVGSTRTAFSLGIIFLLMVCAAVAKGWFHVSRRPALLLLTVGPLLTGALWLLLADQFGWLKAYQKARIAAFFNLIYDPEGISYITATIRKLMGGWQLLGGSPGKVFGFLPGFSYDYIITFLFTSWGIIPGLIILTGFVLLFIRIFRIVLRHPNCLGMMVGLACGLALLDHTLCYVLSNMGFILFSQLSMPFLSYGLGTTVVTYIMMGILLSIYRYKDVLPEPKVKKWQFTIQ
ncbi:FtsW/RodA/SpoVE family cell cycle protein [Clostridium sp. AM58-1XD]|uniref:FtsW/RodA/SpoVE family cell cycle protein n=1 Tax=Clostridium sp. AM58-1XD TaxID=2292307 RepID=UPI0015F64230|nr:FtsW/RodA/SpoVE family cell cycle protein [Clostridium sp. AM58-1XD]